jgi:hypothetical protein
LAKVRGWTFRRWHPSRRFHHDGAMANFVLQGTFLRPSDLLWVTKPLSRTLDHPSPPLPRDPSWTFGCLPPCRPFHAYAPKPTFVFLRYVPVPYALFWLTKRIPSNPVHPTPPFPSVPGWTFRRWQPPRQIDLDSVTVILFFELYSCVRVPSFYSQSLQPRPSPTHPTFSSGSGRTFECWQPPRRFHRCAAKEISFAKVCTWVRARSFR